MGGVASLVHVAQGLLLGVLLPACAVGGGCLQHYAVPRSRVLAVALHAQLEGGGAAVAAVGQHALGHGPAGLQGREGREQGR